MHARTPLCVTCTVNVKFISDPHKFALCHVVFHIWQKFSSLHSPPFFFFYFFFLFFFFIFFNSSYFVICTVIGAHGSIDGWSTLLQARKITGLSPDEVDFSVDLILATDLWPWGRLSLWQKWVPGIFLGVEGSQHIRVTTLLPSVSWLSRENVEASTSHTPACLHSMLQG
jgi:hypothetical protein